MLQISKRPFDFLVRKLSLLVAPQSDEGVVIAFLARRLRYFCELLPAAVLMLPVTSAKSLAGSSVMVLDRLSRCGKPGLLLSISLLNFVGIRAVLT